MENKICVYAIAKNEEKNVERWYESMKEADYIVVLDTGSTDNTVSMLQERGVDVKIKEYAEFHFDEARNDSLVLVPQEYNILVCTDLDEAFEPGWAEILRERWIDGKHEHAQYAYTWDHLADGSNGHTFPYNKIHSRNWIWRDTIHETLCRADGTRDYTAEECLDLYDEIHLHHYQDLSVDRFWYIELAEKRVSENPDDKLAYLELIREYCAKLYNDKCIMLGKDIINYHRDLFDNIDIASVFHQMGIAYLHNEKPQEAILSFISGINNCREYRDNYVELANTYINCSMPDMAIGIIYQALETTRELHHWTESGLSYSWLPYDILSIAYYNKEDYKNAVIYSVKALSYEPTNESLCEKNQLFLSALASVV